MAALPNGTTIILTKKAYNAGSYTSPAESLAPAQSQIILTAERFSWPDTGADVLSGQVDISYDNGQTFILLVAFTAKGGDIISPLTQQVETASTVSIILPQVGNPNRQVKVLVTTFVTLTTQASITVT